MSKIKYVGAENISDPAAKMARLLELAGISKGAIVESKGTSETLLHSIDAANGINYGLVQEGNRVYIKQKVGDTYQYIGGLENKTKEKFISFSEGLKSLNMMLIDINNQAGNVEGTPILKKKSKNE